MKLFKNLKYLVRLSFLGAIVTILSELVISLGQLIGLIMQILMFWRPTVQLYWQMKAYALSSYLFGISQSQMDKLQK